MAQRLTFRWDGESAATRMIKGAARGLHILGEHVLLISNDRVPLDEATLQRSGEVHVDEETLEASITYDTEYAVRQHEDLTLNHPNGRRAKFLESAWRENAHLAPEIIGNQIRRALRG
jgi:hypothetical protein